MSLNFPAARYSFMQIAACNLCRFPSKDSPVIGRRLNGPHGLFPHSRTGITTSVQKCRRCDLIYTNPLPLPIEFGDHYEVSPADYWDPAYLNADPAYFRRELQRLQRLMPQRAGMKALDIGAGFGKGMLALSAAGFDTYGVEPSAAFRQMAVDKMGIAPEKIQHAGIETAVYPASEFDFVTFGAVLEHLPDPAAALRQAVSWVKEGGIIHLEVPSSSWLVSRLANAFYLLTGSGMAANLSPMHSPFHLYEFDPRCFEFHGIDSGYSVAATETFVCNTYLPRPLHWLSPLAQAAMGATGTGMQIVIWLTKGRASV